MPDPSWGFALSATVIDTRPSSAFARLAKAVAAWLPKGGTLPEDDWLRRHRAITGLLFVHAAGLLMFGVIRGYAPLHVMGEAMIPAVCGGLAQIGRVTRSQKAVVATFGLVASSGILVHLSGGTIEAHFHFFIVLAVISLYQEWRTFVLAILFVALHHGIVGVLDPDTVYNHPSAIAQPWTWALIHAAMVLGESVALVAAWRFTEQAHERAAVSDKELILQEKRRLNEQEEAQAAVARREAQLQEAQEIARLGSWDWDFATNLVDGSDELRRIFSIPPEHPAPTFDMFMSGIHEEDLPVARTAIDRALETREPYTVEYRVVGPNGSITHVVASGRVVVDENDKPVRLMGTAQDVTDRKLLETKLIQVQKMEAVGQLAGGIAHDFNNLLAVVTSYGRFAAAALDEGHPVRADVEEIIRAGERGAKLTRQLLTFSRKEVVRPRAVDPDNLVSETERFLSRTIPESIKLTTKLAGDGWRTEIDPGELDQVVMNLAINAKDAMPAGGSLIIETDKVRLADVDSVMHPGVEPGDYVRLQVSDSGTGMSKSVQARIFEPFFTTKTFGEGTGLGLATIYGIVKRAKGYISVYSEVGTGSTFKVYLPRVLHPDEDANGGQAVPLAEQGGDGQLILVVEDEAAVLALTTRILSTNGYRVLKALNGAEALRVVEENRSSIDLLLTDVVMPEMSGRELSERVGVPTLYMSGYTNELITQQGILTEEEALVQKPFTPDDLLSAVRRALARTRK